MCYSVFVKQDLKYLEKNFRAHTNLSEFRRYKQNHDLDSKKYKDMMKNPRIYPGYYAPILISQNGLREVFPMRYRVRPSGSTGEVPARYNLFNARIDSLTSRKTWKNLFMRNHGLVVFERFFEWVIDKKSGKKRVVSFKPKEREVMWAPVLYETWVDTDTSLKVRDQTKILSFAIITTDPPQDILDHGHDRCPVFLKKDRIDRWLNPHDTTKGEVLDILSDIEQVNYLCEVSSP